MLGLLSEKLPMADTSGLDGISKAKIGSLEKLLEKLKGMCVEIYDFHKYLPDLEHPKDYGKLARDAEGICQDILRKRWKEHPSLLHILQIKACCFIGWVLLQKTEYDHALKYLLPARRWTEKEMLEYVIPEFYVEINIGISKCYMEKNYDPGAMNQCLAVASDVLKDPKVGRSIMGEAHYGEYYYHALLLELNLQCAIVELDCYGQNQSINRTSTWKYLKEADGSFQKLDAAKESRNRGFDWEKWEALQNATFESTKGVYFRSLYFLSIEASKALSGNNPSVHKEWHETLRLMADTLHQEAKIKDARHLHFHEHCGNCQRFSRMEHELQQILDLLVQNGNMENLSAAAAKLSDISFEIAFITYAEVTIRYPNNTISLGGMAGMAYDKGKRQGDAEWYPILAGCCPKYKRENAKKSLEELLNETLNIETFNMYALNIKDALDNGSNEPEEADNYPALRQSSLKRKFHRMQNRIPAGVPAPAQKKYVQQITIQIISLYREVINFMNSAIIDCSAKEWEGLTIGHYTKLDIVPKLINVEGDSRFRLHNAHHMNDNREGVLLIDHLRKKLQSEGDAPFIRNIMDKYTDDQAGAVRSFVYIGSLTSRIDVLNMWTRYGDEGRGVCLQFNAAKFFDKEAKYSLAYISSTGGAGNYKMEDIKYPLYMVVYLPDNPEAEPDQTLKKAGTCTGIPAGTNPLEEEPDPLLKKAEAYARARAAAEQYDPLERSWWKKQAQLIHALDPLEKKIVSCLKEIQNVYEALKKSREHASDTEKPKDSGTSHPMGNADANAMKNPIENADDNAGKADAKDEPWEAFEKELCSIIMVILDLIRFLIKRDHFRNEREYRVLQYSSDPSYEPAASGIPRLFVPMEKTPVYQKICFGSRVMDFDSKAAYLLNIRKNSKNREERKTWDIEVCKSGVPIREV